MQPIVHFLMSIVAGLAVGLHLESKLRKYSLILILAIAATCIDLDHLLPVYHLNDVKALHNVFVFIVLPIALFLIFYVYERGKGSSLGQRACLLLTVMFVGTMFLDGISESGLPLFYPFSSERYAIANMGVTIDATLFTLTSEQMIMIIWGAMILAANLVETLTYNDVEGRKPSGLTFWDRTTHTKEKRTLLPAFNSGGLFTNSKNPNSVKTYYPVSHEGEGEIPKTEIADYIFDFVDNQRD